MSDSPRDTADVIPELSGPVSPEFMFDPLSIEEEGLFARDIDGQLVKLVDTTADDYDTEITIKIDGQDVTVKKAVPLKDAQGNIVNDADGLTIPRSTTIYDAAQQLFVKNPGDVNPIPTLCHREHMQPVGVCRVCVVELYRTVDGKRRGGGSLVPACHHRVEPGMEVQTTESSNDPESGRARSQRRADAHRIARRRSPQRFGRRDSQRIEATRTTNGREPISFRRE